eukprot:g35591.t1
MPNEAVEATSLNIFKVKIDRFLNNTGIKGYGEWAVRKRDIVFLIDGSPGMGRSFLQVREFLDSVIQEIDIGPDKDQVAVVQYSSDPRLEFGLNTHSTRDAVLNTIKRMRLKTGRPLNTGAALDYVTRNVFSPSAGSREDAGASQILVLITAGKSRDDVGQAADTMKQAGIMPIAIGAKNADTAQLQKIVYEPNFILKLKDFKELETIQQGLLSMFGVVPVVEEPIPPTDEKLIPPTDEKPIPPIDEKPIPPIDEKPITPIDEKPIAPIDEKPIAPIDEKPIPPIDEKPIPPTDEKPIAPTHEEPILPTDEETIPPAE